jgi:hypothetical protein
MESVPCEQKLCNSGMETSYHLLLDCNVVSLVWRKVCVWLDLKCWSDVVRSKKFQRWYRMIWHAAIWVIRGERNGRIFNSIVKDIDDVVEAIELVSWHWSLCGLKTAACLFYDCVDTSLYSWHHECTFENYVCIFFFTFLFKLICFELQIENRNFKHIWCYEWNMGER